VPFGGATDAAAAGAAAGGVSRASDVDDRKSPVVASTAKIERRVFMTRVLSPVHLP